MRKKIKQKSEVLGDQIKPCASPIKMKEHVNDTNVPHNK